MNTLDDYIRAYEEAEKIAEAYDDRPLISVGYEPVKLKPSEVKILQNKLYKIVYGA